MSMTRFTVMIQGETSTFRQFKQLAVFSNIMILTKKFHVMDLAREFLHQKLPPIVLRLTETFLNLNAMVLIIS